jgi:HAE1 family hydrophobic/amphiphilic exporter-1
MVTVAQPGAAPSELETQVTRRVEDAVAGLGDVKHITSIVQDGVSLTVVEFTLGKSVDRATNDVRDKVAQIRSDLPATIRDPVVSRIEITGGAVVTYTVAAPAMTTEQLSWFVSDTRGQAPALGPRRRPGEPRGRRAARDPRGAEARSAARPRHHGRAGERAAA